MRWQCKHLLLKKYSSSPRFVLTNDICFSKIYVMSWDHYAPDQNGLITYESFLLVRIKVTLTNSSCEYMPLSSLHSVHQYLWNITFLLLIQDNSGYALNTSHLEQNCPIPKMIRRVYNYYILNTIRHLSRRFINTTYKRIFVTNFHLKTSSGCLNEL